MIIGKRFKRGVELRPAMEKVAIARRVHARGRVLILDETDGRARRTKRVRVFRRFKELSAGKTAVSFPTASRVCAWPIASSSLPAADLEAAGTHEELLAGAGGTRSCSRCRRRVSVGARLQPVLSGARRQRAPWPGRAGGGRRSPRISASRRKVGRRPVDELHEEGVGHSRTPRAGTARADVRRDGTWWAAARAPMRSVSVKPWRGTRRASGRWRLGARWPRGTRSAVVVLAGGDGDLDSAAPPPLPCGEVVASTGSSYHTRPRSSSICAWRMAARHVELWLTSTIMRTPWPSAGARPPRACGSRAGRDGGSSSCSSGIPSPRSAWLPR